MTVLGKKYAIIYFVGRIEVNSYGVCYQHPNHSTVLGAILATWHKAMRTPRDERIDMLSLASRLGIELAVGFYESKSTVLRPRFMNVVDFSTAEDRAFRLATAGMSSTIMNVEQMDGSYVVVVGYDEHSGIGNALDQFGISIGKRTGFNNTSRLPEFFDSQSEVEARLRCLSAESNRDLLWVVPFYRETDGAPEIADYFDEKDIESESQKISLSAHLGAIHAQTLHIPLVTQIQRDHAMGFVGRRYVQGLFALAGHVLFDDARPLRSLMVDYDGLEKTARPAIMAEIDRHASSPAHEATSKQKKSRKAAP